MRKLIFLLVLTLSVSTLHAQQELSKKNGKVGLVLSGGGAKGFAHIGVLKVIDSLDIKIDYIAGTSMGAIIGSLYASGYTGKQLDSIFKSINFSDIVNDNLPRSAKTFYERENSEKYAVNLPFEHFKIELPSALSRGQNVYNLLTKLTLHVTDVNDFSKLPIPFFCIGTDIETGESIVLDKGNLAQAVAASGAFPSLFQPVLINERLLIDGGVTNNYPLDELRAKGMDVIIGVDVQDGLYSREQLNSAPDILVQINNYRTINDMIQKAEKTDVYIKPNIKDFTVISFSDGKKIIENGMTAARDQIEQLAELPRYNQGRPRERVKMYRDSIPINMMTFDGNDRYTRSYLLGKLKTKEFTTVSYEDFNSGVNNLVATNNFDMFQYEFKKTNDDQAYDFHATLKESSQTTFLRLGLHFDELYKSAALVNLTKKRLLFDNDVSSLDLILGDNLRYNFEYFIDKGFYWSIGFKSRFNQFNKNVGIQIFLDNDQDIGPGINKIDVHYQDQTNQLFFQTMFRKDFAFIVGAEHKRLKVKSETLLGGNAQSKRLFENTNYYSAFGSLKLDTYDNKYYPKSGFLFNGDFHLYLYASDFNKSFSEFSIAKADIGYAHSFTERFSLNTVLQGGFKIGDDSSKFFNFAIGGYGSNFINNIGSFYGYDFLDLAGNSFVKSTFTFDYEIFKKNHIILAANFANIEDNLFETGDWFKKVDYSGFALGYGLETFLGPVEIKYAHSPELSKGLWYFNVGFWF